MDQVRPDTPVVAPGTDPVVGSTEPEPLVALAQLVGGLAAGVRDETAARLPLLARDVFARLARLLGAERVTLWKAMRGDDRLVVAQAWARTEPGAASRPASAGASATGPEVPQGTSRPVPPASTPGPVGPSAGTGSSPASAPPADDPAAPGVGSSSGPGVDELPWTTSELLGAEVLVASALGGGEAAEPVTAVARGAVAAVTLVVDGALDAVLSIHWPGEASAWSPSLAPLVRVLVGVLRGAEQLAELAERPALDEATGLANRKLLLVALGRSLAQLERRATSGVAVVVCQISAPPEATSQALVRQVGRRLDRQTREGDLVAVFDGHTVVVVCDGVPGPDEALAIARRLSGTWGGADSAESGAGGAEGPGEPVPAAVRVSFGVAHAGQRVAPGVLLRQADAAAYLAATSGEMVRLAEG